MNNPLSYSLTTRFKDRHIIELLSPLPGKSVLDVGCGIGYLSGLLSDLGAEVVGIDIEFSALAYSSKTVDGLFALALADKLPFKSSLFDIVILSDVIEHLVEPDKTLVEIRRIGKPGALVVISTPHLKGFLTGTWITSILHGHNDQHMADYRKGYTVDTLCCLMKSCSIEPKATRYTNPLVSQFLLGIVKLGYFLIYGRYSSQFDLVAASQSKKFKLYRNIVFPLAYTLGRLEEKTLGRWIPGHCLIVKGAVIK
jgi:ubiquinone/menaquinone biosynthesis C-methylase UbiE